MFFTNSNVGNGVNNKVDDIPLREPKDQLTGRVKTIIDQGDVEALRKLISNLKNSEREFLITWQTRDESSKPCCHGYSSKVLRKPCPLIFEAISRDQTPCLEVLLGFGFKLESTDTNGWNVLHYLIAISHYDESYEERAVEIWKKVAALLQERDLLKRILTQEDLDGLRPVELAMHVGCILLFDEIINAEGVYLESKSDNGLWENIFYDVTEYENILCCSSRRSKSLPLLACHLDTKVLKKNKHMNVLLGGMMSKWAKSKMIINFLPVLIWFCLRFYLCLAFYIVISADLPRHFKAVAVSLEWVEFFDYANYSYEGKTEEQHVKFVENYLESNETTPDEQSYVLDLIKRKEKLCTPLDWYHAIEETTFFWTCFYCMYGFSLVFLIYDGLELIVAVIRKWYKWRFAFGKLKAVIISSVYYRICQLIFCCFVLVWLGFYLNQPENELAKYCVIPTCYVSVWSVLYFIQMAPSVGRFVNSIQRMLTIMMQFLVVYFFILIPYPHAFLVLLTTEESCQVPGFNTAPEAWYSVFKIMLNMVDFGDYNSNGLQAANVVHIIYVFTVAILLVNFLIALLSTSVGETVEAGDVTMMLQRLSIAMTVERRVLWIFPCYYRLMHRLVYTCKNRKVYLKHSRFSGIRSSSGDRAS